MSSPVLVTSSLREFAIRSRITPASVEPAELLSLTAPAGTLRAIDWGGPPERTVLFLHGGGLTAHTWDLVCLALRGRYRCVALDLRGHGDSDWPSDADYRLEALADDIEAVLGQLGGPAPVLIGHSMGGQAALLAVGRGADACGLGLIDVGPEPDPRAALSIIRWISAPAVFADLDEAIASALTMNPRRDPTVLSESLLHNLRRLPSGGLTWKYDARAFSGLTTEVLQERSRTLWSAVPGVAVPVLLALGAQSAVVSPSQADELCWWLDDCRVQTVPEAGHTVQGDNPAGLEQILRPWLEHCYAGGPAPAG